MQRRTSFQACKERNFHQFNCVLLFQPDKISVYLRKVVTLWLTDLCLKIILESERHAQTHKQE